MVLPRKSLDMETILACFYMKVYTFLCFIREGNGERMGRKMALPFLGIQCYESFISLLFHFLFDHDHPQRQQLLSVLHGAEHSGQQQ